MIWKKHLVFSMLVDIVHQNKLLCGFVPWFSQSRPRTFPHQHFRHPEISTSTELINQKNLPWSRTLVPPRQFEGGFLDRFPFWRPPSDGKTWTGQTDGGLKFETTVKKILCHFWREPPILTEAEGDPFEKVSNLTQTPHFDWEGPLSVSYTHLTLPTKRIV